MGAGEFARSGGEGPFDPVARDIAECGWACMPDFVDAPTWRALSEEAWALWRGGALAQAAVGKGRRRVHAATVRSDYIRWLEAPGATPAQRTYFERIDALRLALNRAFFLGLFEYEGHFAFYPPGTFYGRHLDRFRGTHQRVLSCVLYLNEAWAAQDGGQLRLYVPGGTAGAMGSASAGDEQPVDIEPRGGTLVCFLSEAFHHEVLETRRERVSLTGWFKLRC